MFYILKDFPLNFRVTTWRFSQWVATIIYIVFMYIFSKQYFGSWHDTAIVFMTPLGFIALAASFCAQLYVYGGFISNTSKDIIVPAIIIGVVFIVELAFSYVMKNLEYTAAWGTYFLRYFMLFIMSAVQLWVYNDVEFLIVPKDEINKE